MKNTFMLLLSSSVFLTVASCKPRTFNAGAKSQTPQGSWESIRTQRQAAVDQHLNRGEGYRWFRDFPNGNTGLPVIFLRSIAESDSEFSSILGPAKAKYSKFGLGPHPLGENYPFPLGLGWSLADGVPMNVGTLTCGACHVGRVIGPDNKVALLVGAPNTQFDPHLFVTSLVKLAQHEKFNADSIRSAIQRHSGDADWLYGRNDHTNRHWQNLKETAMERTAQTFESFVVKRRGEEIVKSIKDSFAERDRKIAVVREGAYKVNAGGSLAGGNPGRADAFSVALALISSPEELKEEGLLANEPAMVDIMSVWMQKRRVISQWDGFLRNPLLRNLGAELGVTGQPDKVDFKNAVVTRDFLQELPPPPYVFNIDMAAAERGKALYTTHCAGCHQEQQDDRTKPFPLAAIGTDPNRALGLTPKGLERLNKALMDSCPKSEPECTNIPVEDRGMAFPDNQKGYVAPPLDGIWARAPYLHNGSIPTLMHLLVPELRQAPEAKTFWRGNIAYDTKWVGFEWRHKKAPEGFNDPYMLNGDREFIVAQPYDTSLRGNSNKGHDRYARKWSADANTPEGKDTLDLLEFLKTL